MLPVSCPTPILRPPNNSALQNPGVSLFVCPPAHLLPAAPSHRRLCHEHDCAACALDLPWHWPRQPVIEGGPAARACSGPQAVCFKSLVADRRGQPVLTVDALFEALDSAQAAAAGPSLSLQQRLDLPRVGLICPERVLFWRVVSAKRSPPTTALVRQALAPAILGRPWGGPLAESSGKAAAGGPGASAAGSRLPLRSADLDALQLTRPPTAGGYDNAAAVTATMEAAAIAAGVRFRRVRALSFSAEGPHGTAEDAAADAVAGGSDWSMVRQAEALASAAVFVAPHGAGLTHLNWMPPGGCVIEVFPECLYDPSYSSWSAGANFPLSPLRHALCSCPGASSCCDWARR